MNTHETTTPETDAAENCIDDLPQFPFVSSNFARRLERERDNYREQADALVDRLGATQVRMIDAERERDSLSDQRDFAQNLIRILERERDEAREALKTGGMLDIIDRAGHERAAAIRERDEALERADTMFAKHVDILDQARRERDEARATCSELVTDSNALTLAQTVVRVTQERDEARAQRDRLAKALGQIADLGQMICMAWEPQSFKATEIATDALATLNQPEP